MRYTVVTCFKDGMFVRGPDYTSLADLIDYLRLQERVNLSQIKFALAIRSKGDSVFFYPPFARNQIPMLSSDPAGRSLIQLWYLEEKT